MTERANKISDAFLGLAVGDAVGVPFEFRSREMMEENPANDMVGFGTHRQPAGTWSDDAALTFCLAESLLNGYDLQDIAQKFIQWKREAYWSARGTVFDIGITTAAAIDRLVDCIAKGDIEGLRMQKYYGDEYDNGNGSLMRILPLLVYIQGKPIQQQFETVWEVSALTHRHIRAAMGCLIYLKLAEKLWEGMEKHAAYAQMRKEILDFWDALGYAPAERAHYRRLIEEDILQIPVSQIKSSGYVVDVLEASIWFFLQQDSFAEVILGVINLGNDTDTAAAIAGGLAGLNHGREGIPPHWLAQLARKEDIVDLGNRLGKEINEK